jgi:hypothetical protein
MDKKEINSPPMTADFLIWIGGVFMTAFVRLHRPLRVENPIEVLVCRLSQIKVAPFGATIQRGKEFWKVMSGKAMHGAVLPARTAVREMSRAMEESEGHFSLSVSGLFCY